MGFITISRNNGRISMGGVKDASTTSSQGAKKGPNKAYDQSGANPNVQAYRDLVNKRTQPKIPADELDAIFNNVGLVAKK